MIYSILTAGVNFQANSNLWNFKDSVFGCVRSKTKKKKKKGSGKSRGSQVSTFTMSKIFLNPTAFVLTCSNGGEEPPKWRKRNVSSYSSNPALQWNWYFMRYFAAWSSTSNRTILCPFFCPQHCLQPQLQGHPSSRNLHLENRAREDLNQLTPWQLLGWMGAEQEESSGWWQRWWHGPGNNKEWIYI